MAKLHELLAVEKPLENQANKVRADLANTFEKKRHLFEEKRVTFTASTENSIPVTEHQSDVQTCVHKELNWIAPHLVKALDASYQVACANTVAKADVVLDDGADTVLLSNVPATALLELEKRVAELLALVGAIPTLDPAKGFAPDPARVPLYVAREVVKDRTRKTVRVLVKYEATKEHPAQTELINEDVPIGKLRELEWSGLVTPTEKAGMLARVEILARAVRAARSRANEIEVQKGAKIGKVLVDYVFGA